MNVDDHAHCEICSRTIPLGERLCDRDECQEAHEAAIREKKRSMYLFIAVIVAAVLLTQIL